MEQTARNARSITSTVSQGEPYALAFVLMPVPALLLDDSRVVSANEAACKLLETLHEAPSALRALQGLSGNAKGRSATLEAGTTRYRVTITLLSPVSRLRLCLLFAAAAPDEPDPYGRWGLTPPERAVADLLLRGMKNREIGESLRLSIETVRKHVAHILMKSGARTRAEFVALTLRGTS